VRTAELLATVEELAAGEQVSGDVVRQGFVRVSQAEGVVGIGVVLHQQLVVLAPPLVPLVRR
jgi:hypothetical protein